MKVLTKALVLFALLVTPTVVRAQADVTQGGKTVAIVSIAPVDSLLADIAYVTQVAGSPDAGKMVAGIAQPYTQGLDTTKPIGVVVTVDKESFRPLGFLPVKDLNAALAPLKEQIGEPKDAGNGVLELAGPVPIFIKEQNGFAFVGQTVESLANLPQDPTTLLDGLNTQYDIAIRAHVSNVPEQYRKLALTQIKQGAEMGLGGLPADDAEAAELQKKLVQAQIQQMEALVNETDQITLGWSIDREAQKTYLDVTMTAVAGTKTARRMAMLADAESDFTGFLMPGAAMTMNAAGKIPPEEIQRAVTMLNSVRGNAIKEIEADDDLPDEQARTVAKELVGSLFDVVTATIQSGKMDGGAALTLQPQSIALMAGFYVADGSQLETTLKKLVELAQREPDFPGVQFDADKHAGVNFHTMSVPIPEDEEEARKALGEKLDVVVGIGPKSAYVSVGNNGLTRLKEAIDKSAAAADKSVPPFQLTVALAPILKFAAGVDDNPVVAALAATLEKANGKDHVLINSKTVPNGVSYRIEVEEGVLQAIGTATQMAGGGVKGEF